MRDFHRILILPLVVILLLVLCFTEVRSKSISKEVDSRHDCPIQLKRDQYLQVHGDKCYRFELNALKTFRDAQTSCQREGGNLVMVDSKPLNDFLKSQLVDTYGQIIDPVWIGLRYEKADSNGDYQLETVDGDLAEYHNFPKNHKRFYHEVRECVVLMPWQNGEWEIQKCHKNTLGTYAPWDPRHRFICEYPRGEISTACPSTAKRDKFLVPHKDTCYRFELKEAKSFDEARKVCQKQGGDLAVVKSQQTQDFLTKTLNLDKFGSNKMYNDIGTVWIGLSFDQKDIQLKWVDGSGLEYNAFDDGDFYKVINPCIVMTLGKYWRVEECRNVPEYDMVAEKRMFICEFDSVQTTTIAATNTTKSPTKIAITTSNHPNNTQEPLNNTTSASTTINPDENITKSLNSTVNPKMENTTLTANSTTTIMSPIENTTLSLNSTANPMENTTNTNATVNPKIENTTLTANSTINPKIENTTNANATVNPKRENTTLSLNSTANPKTENTTLNANSTVTPNMENTTLSLNSTANLKMENTTLTANPIENTTVLSNSTVNPKMENTTLTLNSTVVNHNMENATVPSSSTNETRRTTTSRIVRRYETVSIGCSLHCGMRGYQRDPITGFVMCQCA